METACLALHGPPQSVRAGHEGPGAFSVLFCHWLGETKVAGLQVLLQRGARFPATLMVDPVPLLPSPKCPNSFPPSPSPSPVLTNKWTNKKQVATVSMLNVSSPLTVASQKSARRPEEQRVPPGLPRGFALILAWAGEGGGCRGCIFPSS